MSADNYIVIRKEGRRYKGYMQFASDHKEDFTTPSFVTTSLKKAIKIAQTEYAVCEYGYRVDEIW